VEEPSWMQQSCGRKQLGRIWQGNKSVQLLDEEDRTKFNNTVYSHTPKFKPADSSHQVSINASKPLLKPLNKNLLRKYQRNASLNLSAVNQSSRIDDFKQPFDKDEKLSVN